jgi:sec-independent protein translocase protein TatA
MFNTFGPLEIALVLLIVLIIFGPKRLPGLGKQLGRGMREFKESITGESKDDSDDVEDDGARKRAAIAAAPAQPVEPAPAAGPAEPVEPTAAAASEALGRPSETGSPDTAAKPRP